MRASQTREICQGIRVLFPLGSQFQSFFKQIGHRPLSWSAIEGIIMARSLEWTSPCEKGKKIKGTVSRNLSKFKQQDSTYKRRPFFKTW